MLQKYIGNESPACKGATLNKDICSSALSIQQAAPVYKGRGLMTSHDTESDIRLCGASLSPLSHHINHFCKENQSSLENIVQSLTELLVLEFQISGLKCSGSVILNNKGDASGNLRDAPLDEHECDQAPDARNKVSFSDCPSVGHDGQVRIRLWRQSLAT